MGCPSMPGEFGDDISMIELRKKLAQEEIKEMDKEIERLRAEKEQEKKINLLGLYARMDSFIRTQVAPSSFTDVSIGEVSEMKFGSLEVVESYAHTIDVEISGRHVDSNGEVYHTSSVKELVNVSRMNDPTLVVSFLIPMDLVDSDPFFRDS